MILTLVMHAKTVLFGLYSLILVIHVTKVGHNRP